MLPTPSLKEEWMCIAMLMARVPRLPAARAGAATAGSGPTAAPIPSAAPAVRTPRRVIADVMPLPLFVLDD
ncbi:hypothetical protein GCM10009790_08640 [Georgenia ruanii]